MKKKELRELYLSKVQDGYASDVVDEIIEVLKDGGGSKYIDRCLLNGEEVVRKICLTKNSYIREKKALEELHDFDHTPKLVGYDDERLILIMEYKGESLQSIPPKERSKYLPQIGKVLDELKGRYSLYHNDVRWKNITLRDDRLYLVDFQRIDEQDKEYDGDHIIRKITNL